ncbi:PUA-like domain-containing protein [Suillus plorans]|uniref:PUA-like domain-containing protein n=1 Tax=Suillus plorans TaxID=116603 RepID=A0A9P7DX61_9AGAM|nr:PUA-like domain-containing protein [Suillus plorans]KAG1805091.1 PUA-like domain-containing protein [Suillus plorans]
MDYLTLIKQLQVGVKNYHYRLGEEIEEHQDEIASEKDKEMVDDPEVIASKGDEEIEFREKTAGKVVNVTEEDPEVIASESDEETQEPPKRIAPKVTKEVRASRARMLRRFGAIPGVPVGATWMSRKDCYQAGIHRHHQAGIQGSKMLGACSIVVSGQYDDDKDFGDTILYVGSGGGLDNNGWPKNPGPQVSNQEWTGWGNQALLQSCHTGKPVRVVRSSNFVSKFAPLIGYRYDGLYTVTHACREKDSDGRFYICRYNLERIPGQPPLPRRPSVGYDIESSRSTPTSIATSDTIVLPSETSTSRKRSFEDDLMFQRCTRQITDQLAFDNDKECEDLNGSGSPSTSSTSSFRVIHH